jgi:hypothetical protein
MVAVSVVEPGAAEASTELVVGVADAVSVGAGVGAAEASVGLTVGETAVLVEMGAVEVSVGAAGASVIVGADSAVLAVGLETVAVVVSVAVSRGSLTVPPFQPVAIKFVILVAQFPTTEEHADKRGWVPHPMWADSLGQLPECSDVRQPTE